MTVTVSETITARIYADKIGSVDTKLENLAFRGNSHLRTDIVALTNLTWIFEQVKGAKIEILGCYALKRRKKSCAY